MLSAMLAAGRAPSAFGLREDPRVQNLESRIASLLGHEDALFCPSCTLANQIAIHLHCRAGDAVVAEAHSHIFTSEAGAMAALSGVMALPVAGSAGVRHAKALDQALRPGDVQRSSAGLLVLENTHVRSGGCVVPLAQMTAFAQAAHKAQVPVHLDGARLANAAVALDVPLTALTQYTDSVAFSLNKSLGAPLGAMLAGPKTFIHEAERVRQRFGGGWRPAGMLAAAALVALDGWEARLGIDHARASALVGGLEAISKVQVEPAAPRSNLVLASVAGVDAQSLTHKLFEQEIQVIAFSPKAVRLALYHDISDADVARTIEAFSAICA